MTSEDFRDIPVERRQADRRRQDLPVPVDRRRADRRQAQRLSPARPFAGVAVVADSWPLVRAGIVQLLEQGNMRVAGAAAAARPALDAVGDRLDLAVFGDIADPPLTSAIKAAKAQPAPEDLGTPRVLVLLDTIEADLLRALLDLGVEGVLMRNASLTDLQAACERILAGQRVLAGPALSILAGAGLRVAPTAPTAADELGLTIKEREVLAHLAERASNREIAEALHVSEATVKTHLRNIYAKLGVDSRQEAVIAAVERGLLA